MIQTSRVGSHTLLVERGTPREGKVGIQLPLQHILVDARLPDLLLDDAAVAGLEALLLAQQLRRSGSPASGTLSLRSAGVGVAGLRGLPRESSSVDMPN